MCLDKGFRNVHIHDMTKLVDISSLDIARDAARNCVCFQVRKLSRRITRAYDSALGETGLKITQFTMLAAVVGSCEGLSLTDLADRLGMDRSTFSRNLAPLVKRGLVEHADTLKGRRRNVRATESGCMLFKATAPAWQRAQDRLRRQLNEAGQAEFLADLRAVADAIKR
ncbi:MAG: winged helix-turn-helix transcriptional regulator [Gemmatimonadetes bacterium]|nr:winged helix-turn-helix transcriptional regulator [Gemmatimonadota bacterium]